MLKYNHDSSASIRFLGGMLDVLECVREDLFYLPNFTLTDLEFVNIDRMNAFVPASITGWSMPDKSSTDYLIGYSRYTNQEYTLKIEELETDFVRHSLPVDAFFSDLHQTNSGTSFDLSPNIRTTIDMSVENSSISFALIYGFINSNKDNVDLPISIIVEGRNIHNELVSEKIDIQANITQVSSREYSYIDSVIAINCQSNIGVKIYPYLIGQDVVYDKLITDRESLDQWPCITYVDKEKKQLVFNMLGTDTTKYPLTYEKHKTVDIDIPDSEDIVSYYCDVPNRLLYVCTVGDLVSNLYAFPLIIPVSYSNTLDNLKTEKQAIKIEYLEDCQNDNFTFWVYPSSKTNDIDLMSIYINGTLYQEDIFLDLLTENIETNRFVVPFSSLFSANKTNALVEFKAYGNAGETNMPVYLTRDKLTALYVKDTLTASPFVTDVSPFEYVGPIDPLEIGDYFEEGAYAYGEGEYGGTTDTTRTFAYGGSFDKNTTNLFKLSSVGNILIDGIKIINVFDSFYYDDINELIITSDTITHIKINADSDLLGTAPDEAFVTEKNNPIGV
jgi:hypothetical protein